jgi:hypothetical protein
MSYGLACVRKKIPIDTLVRPHDHEPNRGERNAGAKQDVRMKKSLGILVLGLSVVMGPLMVERRRCRPSG